MFNNGPTNLQLEQQLKQQHNEQKEVEHSKLQKLNHLVDLVEKKIEEDRVPNVMEESLVLGVSPLTFDTYGYPYNAFFVNDTDGGTVLTVSYYSVNYSIVLDSGLNELDLPNGAILNIQQPTGVTGKVLNVVCLRRMEPFNASQTVQQVENQEVNRFKVDDTTQALGVGATFTGASVDTLNYRRVTGFVTSDQTGSLYVQHSTDGVNWFSTYSSVLSASGIIAFDVVTYARYTRVRFVNGSTLQTTFRLCSYICAV